MHTHFPKTFPVRCLLLLLLILTMGCAEDAPPGISTNPSPKISPQGQMTSRSQKMTRRQNCPNVDSLLLQAIESDNPVETAKLLGLRVKNGKVQVMILMKEYDPGFFNDFEVEVGSRSRDRIQAFMPLERICELARMDSVIAIHTPLRGAIPSN